MLVYSRRTRFDSSIKEQYDFPGYKFGLSKDYQCNPKNGLRLE